MGWGGRQETKQRNSNRNRLAPNPVIHYSPASHTKHTQITSSINYRDNTDRALVIRLRYLPPNAHFFPSLSLSPPHIFSYYHLFPASINNHRLFENRDGKILFLDFEILKFDWILSDCAAVKKKNPIMANQTAGHIVTRNRWLWRQVSRTIIVSAVTKQQRSC